MKKRRTKLRKFLLRTLLFLLLLAGLVTVLLRSQTVQTIIAQRTAKWLSKELQVKVGIRAMEFDFFRNIHLEGLYMADRKGDTMLAAEVLDLALRKYDSKVRRVDFYSVVFQQANIHIGFHKDEKDKNIDFLIDYINGPKKEKKGPPKIWTIFFERAELKDSRFVNFDEDEMATEKGLLDQYNLQFNRINGELEKLWVIDDSLQFISKKLSTKERSGLDIENFKAICNIHFKGMDFTRVDLQTACSRLFGELHFSYPGYNKLDKFVSNTQWNSHLQRSSLCLSELSIFDPLFIGHPEKLDVRNLKISGTYDHLRLNEADFRMGKETHITGNFYLEGLPKWQTAFCQFDIPFMTTNAAELSRLLYGMELPSLMYEAGTMTASGKFTGQFEDFHWDGLINSDFGEIKTDVSMNFKPGVKNAEFSGRILSNHFDLGIINESLGPSGFDIQLDGKGLDRNSFSMEVKADFKDFIIRERPFNDAHIEGELTAKNFKGKAEFNDVRLNSTFDGSIDFTKAQPAFHFVAETRGIDLYALNLDTAHSLIWGTFRVDATGFTPDDFDGRIDLDNLAIQRNEKLYEFSEQHLVQYHYGKETRLDLDGKMITGFIAGKYSIENLPAIAINSMADIFPERIARKEYEGNDSFLYDITIPRTELLCAYVSPELKTSKLHFQGNYFKNAQSAVFVMDPLDFEYGEWNLKNLDLGANLTDDSALRFTISSAEISKNKRKIFVNVGIDGNARDGKASYRVLISDSSGKYRADILAKSVIMRDSITFALGNSRLNLLNENWVVSEESNLVMLNDGRIICNELFLGDAEHYIELHGAISANRGDTTYVDFGNINFDELRPILAGTDFSTIKGKLTGDMKVAGILGSPKFEGTVSGKNLVLYGQDFGDVELELIDLKEEGRISTKFKFLHGILSGLKVEGSVGYDNRSGGPQLALNVHIPDGTSLMAAQPFLKDILTIKEGTIDGDIIISGKANEPKIEGDAWIRNARIKIDYLNTNYFFNARLNADSKGFYTAEPVILKDESATGQAVVRMAITHKNFDDYYMDIRIDSARNLKVLNTTAKQNSLYYGTAWADGTCHIYGPFDKINMDISLKNRKNSRVVLQYSDVEENERMGFVRFVKKAGVKDTVEQKVGSNVINRIKINLVVNPELDAAFVIDKQLGDVIRGHGNANLQMLYDEHENFYLYGNYSVIDGQYVFSLPGINLITRKIDLEKGGTITWSGDPFNAVLNMTGSFEKKISPAVLMTATSTQKSYTPIRVESRVFMRGNLFSPDIKFDIRAPDLEANSGGTAQNDVYLVIQQIRADKDETTRQAMALLLFGNFITPSFAQNTSSGSVITGTALAGNTLSVIANNVVNDIFNRLKLGIPVNIQVNIDDVKSRTGGSTTRFFVNTEWFLTEKIRLDVNYDPTVAIPVNDNLAVPFNLTLEYTTRNEELRFKVFSRSSNLALQLNNSTITNGVSGNTLGTGIVWRHEFETLWPWRQVVDSSAAKPPLKPTPPPTTDTTRLP